MTFTLTCDLWITSAPGSSILWQPWLCLQGLLPDGLHPNAAGMDLIAQCLEESLAPLLGNAQNGTFPRTVASRQYDSRVAELPC